MDICITAVPTKAQLKPICSSKEDIIFWMFYSVIYLCLPKTLKSCKNLSWFSSSAFSSHVAHWSSSFPSSLNCTVIHLSTFLFWVRTLLLAVGSQPSRWHSHFPQTPDFKSRATGKATGGRAEHPPCWEEISCSLVFTVTEITWSWGKNN